MRLGLSLTDVVIASLAVWRLTHLFWNEDGPWDCFVRLRRLAGDTIVGRLLDCFYCLSLWVAAPFAIWIGRTGVDRVIAWLAISGAAILWNNLSTGLGAGRAQAPVVWREESAPVEQREES